MKNYFLNLHNTENIPELLDDYQKVDWLMIRLILLHWLFVSTFSAMFYDTYLFGFVSGGILAALGLFSYRLLHGTPMFRIVSALILMTYTIISIQQSQGSIEMHFHIFIILSFLAAYKDIRPVSAASVLTIVHHLVFNYLQQYHVMFFGMPIMVFNYGCGLDIVMLHAFFVIFEWWVLIWVIKSATKKFLDEVEAKQKIQLLANKLKLSATVFEHADEGIIVTDNKGIILSINHAFEEVTGYTKKELIGKTPAMLKSAQHDNIFFQKMWDSINTKGTWKGQIWNRIKNGDIIPMWLTISAIYDHKNNIENYIALLTDMSNIVKAQEEINYMAYHDALTGLPNRMNFAQQLQHAISLAKRNRTRLAVLFIDLDRFKNINDTLGHQTGDEMLKIISKRLSKLIRESDTFARIGGDEFLILTENLENDNSPAFLAKKINDTIRKPIVLNEHTLHTSASIGISIFPEDGKEEDILIKAADSAMYCAKDEGKNTFRFFTQKLSKQILRRMQLENEMRYAIKKNEFSLAYQPYYKLQTKEIIGAEALLRWKNKKFGTIEPAEFIPIAEDSHMIEEIGMWVFKEACQNFMRWKKEHPLLQYISINISSVQVIEGKFIDTILSMTKEIGIEPSNIEFEITERLIVEQTQQNLKRLEKLREHGFKIAVDDFGTGYSSMNYLKILPLDTLKIDKSFIHGLPEDENDIAIIKAILTLTKNLNYKVIAEGIENKVQEEFLISQECQVGQGYFFSKPMNAQDFEEKLG